MSSMTLRQWYGSAVRVPDSGDYQFAEFAACSMGIVNSVLRRKLGRSVSTRFMPVETAYADPDHSLIVVNHNFLTGKFGNGIPVQDGDSSLTAILGVVVHEAGHFAYSPKDMQPLLTYVQEHTKLPFQPMVARTVGNIIEDIYIEAELDRRLPNLSWMVRHVNSLFFSTDSYESAIKKVQKLDGSPQNYDQVTDLLNILIFAKTRPTLAFCRPFVTNLYALTRSAVELHQVAERFDLALTIYDLVMAGLGTSSEDAPNDSVMHQETASEADSDGSVEDETEVETETEDKKATGAGQSQGQGDDAEDEGEGQGQGGGEGEGESDGEGQGGKSLSDEPAKGMGNTAPLDDSGLDEVRPNLNGSAGMGISTKVKGMAETVVPTDKQRRKLEQLERQSHGLTSSGSDDATTGGRMSAIANTVNNRIFSLRDDEVELGTTSYAGRIDSAIFIERAMEQVERVKPIQVDPRYSRLAEVGRQRAAVNRPYGLDQKRGTHLRRLHRIATDGKVFAQPVQMQNFKPMQVIIMVDCSGSMNQKIQTFDYTTPTRMQLACEAALGAAIGLSEARCEVAVYGHTSDVAMPGDTLIYRAKGFNEPMAGLDHRLADMLRCQPHNSNRDGYAIEYVGRKFRGEGKRKLLIVISDGQPSSSMYYGEEAVKHMAHTVKNLRSQGVDVMSISITREAQNANDKAYGPDWNLYNDDPNVIEQVIKSLLLD